MSGGQPTVEDLGATSLPRSGPIGWLQHVLESAGQWPGLYRRALARNRRRTILLTVVTILLITYPLIYRFVLSGISRSVFPLPLPDDTIMVFMLIFAAMALGLNIVIGFAGLLDLGYVAFYALGAYTLGWFGSDLFTGRVDFHFGDWTAIPGLGGIHLNYWLILVLGGVVAAIAGIIIGWPTLRLRGDYLAIVTLGFGEIIPDVFRNADAVAIPKGLQTAPPFLDFEKTNITNGVRGVKQLDRPGFGEEISSWTGGLLPDRFSIVELKPWFYLILIMVLVTVFVNRRLRDSKMGRAWIAVREDEVAASAMGIPLMRTKLWAYGIGAVFGGLAGAFYGAFIGSVFPTSFFFNISILILCMVIVGGMGNIWGVVLGAVVLEYLNLKGLDKIGLRINDAIDLVGIDAQVDIPKYKFLIFGALLVIMMLFRPEGLIPSARRKAEFEEGGQEAVLYGAQQQ
jgi:branched-chain amino acid transport system permease protein